MATLLDESFETTALGGFTTATSPAPTRVTDVFTDGIASLYVDATGAAKYNQLTISGRVVVARFYYRITTATSATASIFVCNAGVSHQIQARTGPALRANCGATNSANSANLNTGQWYLIDVYADSSTGTASIAYKIDGVDQAGATVAQAAQDFANLRLGNTSTPTYQMHFDAFKATNVAGDYPLGGVAVADVGYPYVGAGYYP